MRAVPDQLRNVNEATVSMCTQRIITELNKDIKSLQINLNKALKDNIKLEVCRRIWHSLFWVFTFFDHRFFSIVFHRSRKVSKHKRPV